MDIRNTGGGKAQKDRSYSNQRGNNKPYTKKDKGVGSSVEKASEEQLMQCTREIKSTSKGVTSKTLDQYGIRPEGIESVRDQLRAAYDANNKQAFLEVILRNIRDENFLTPREYDRLNVDQFETDINCWMPLHIFSSLLSIAEAQVPINNFLKGPNDHITKYTDQRKLCEKGTLAFNMNESFNGIVKPHSYCILLKSMLKSMLKSDNSDYFFLTPIDRDSFLRYELTKQQAEQALELMEKLISMFNAIDGDIDDAKKLAEACESSLKQFFSTAVLHSSTISRVDAFDALKDCLRSSPASSSMQSLFDALPGIQASDTLPVDMSNES